MTQLTVPIEGEEDIVIVLRDKSDRFKSWERRGLYESFDKLEGGVAIKELYLMRQMSAHIVRSWSLDVPPPTVEYKNGEIVYSNLKCYDDLDADVEAAIMLVAGPMVEKLKLNFAPSQDKASPTKPVGD